MVHQMLLSMLVITVAVAFGSIHDDIQKQHDELLSIQAAITLSQLKLEELYRAEEEECGGGTTEPTTLRPDVPCRNESSKYPCNIGACHERPDGVQYCHVGQGGASGRKNGHIKTMRFSDAHRSRGVKQVPRQVRR